MEDVGLEIGEQDEFEGTYAEKFRTLLRPYGEFIQYERDRSGLDLGLQLKIPSGAGSRVVPTRVWFQLKGIRQSTLSKEEFGQNRKASVTISINHLCFWYASSEPVYLVIYLESTDEFYADDVCKIVERNWGEQIFIMRNEQKTVCVTLSDEFVFSLARLEALGSHRSIRIDGPSFRGRPLGHRLDPLRCTPERFEPSVFARLIRRLLEVHGFDTLEELKSPFSPSSDGVDESIYTAVGRLRFTYEWVLQMTTQFGVTTDCGFRIEGTPFHTQGPCGILVDPVASGPPAIPDIARFTEELTDLGVPELLVFANTHDGSYFGSFSAGVRGTSLKCAPQLLGDLAFNLLIATNVYLEFRSEVRWRSTNYLWDVDGESRELAAGFGGSYVG